jgi:Fe-S cluster biogenesis protein NfuA
MNEDVFARAKKLVEEEIRPMIQSDGGDIEAVELTADMVLKVRLSGACVNCASSAVTLAFGIENRIRDEIPEILAVENTK